MTAFRFIHSSDFHLGKRFRQFPQHVRRDLHQARQSIIGALAEAARDHDARHILVAGDVFDTETPAPPVWQQALADMGQEPSLHWWMIPGTHDNLDAAALWSSMTDKAPQNVHILDTPKPVDIAPNVRLLPAPVARPLHSADPTAWMDQCATPEGSLRIGLAHGGMLGFGRDEGRTETISPDRAATARLDYLALGGWNGGWHGGWTLNERARYCGAPERDSFAQSGRGICLAVTLPRPKAETGPAASPIVKEITLGQFDWHDLELRLTPDHDPVVALEGHLPGDRYTRQGILLKIRATGWLHLSQRMRLYEAISRVSPEFCYVEVDDHQLQTHFRPNDLDDIARVGAGQTGGDVTQDLGPDERDARWDHDGVSGALNRLLGLVKRGRD